MAAGLRLGGPAAVLLLGVMGTTQHTQASKPGSVGDEPYLQGSSRDVYHCGQHRGHAASVVGGIAR